VTKPLMGRFRPAGRFTETVTGRPSRSSALTSFRSLNTDKSKQNGSLSRSVQDIRSNSKTPAAGGLFT
jgi:hypothetical protein